MTDQQKLALAQHVLASLAQALVLLHEQSGTGDTLPLPRAWGTQWLAEAHVALCQLRRNR
jgi:hypothetical protein